MRNSVTRDVRNAKPRGCTEGRLQDRIHWADARVDAGQTDRLSGAGKHII